MRKLLRSTDEPRDKTSSRRPAYCPQCDSRRQQRTAPTHGAWPDDWQVVQCMDCDQRRLDPLPAPEDWPIYYPSDYGPYQAPPVKRLGKRLELRLQRWVMGRLRQRPDSSAPTVGQRVLSVISKPWIEPDILPVFGGGTMLEIGCGAGEYLARMQDVGWSVLGVEMSPEAALRARKAFGVEVIAGNFPHPDLPTESFDLVALRQVLEHLEQPRQALAAIHALLRTSGKLLISVPNHDSWSARHFGAAWDGWQPPRHVNHFTPTTLLRMLHAEGFAVEQCEKQAQGGWIRNSAANARAQHAPLACRILSNRCLSDAVARYTAWIGQGDDLHVLAQRQP